MYIGWRYTVRQREGTKVKGEEGKKRRMVMGKTPLEKYCVNNVWKKIISFISHA